jgi:tRNA(Ile)-lysidine synthase
LKNLLREAGVPAWQRERLPLLFCGEAAVWAPGVGCDCRFAAAAGEKGVLPRWVP